ncbi:MAG: PLP-dependent transferase [Planctomycetota bacterium]|nr:PLP-dependent transferase [Planctomycetota bacterium]
MRPATRLIRGTRCGHDPYRATAPPLYQTATFAQATATGFDAYDYSRTDNPTRRLVEDELASLEGGHGALAYSSGMAAVAAALRLAPTGARVLVAQDLYGGTERLLDRLDLEVARIDTTDPASWTDAVFEGAHLCYLETPSNPLLETTDLRALARWTRRHGVVLVVDNTMLSPWLQRPLELGADLVVQSCTKHLAGHGDLTAGALIAKERALYEPLAFQRNAEGTALAPFDAWLLSRGLKTLGVRLERAQDTARQLVKFLRGHPAVTRVRDVGMGSVLAFETGDVARSQQVVEGTELFSIAVSFGGVASSISLPCVMSHASVPAARRSAVQLPPDLVRIAVGLEDPGDLIADLDRALSAPRGQPRPATASA